MYKFSFLRNAVKSAVAVLAAAAVFAGCTPEEPIDNGAGKPEAVINFTATAGNAQVVLTWNEPAENGGAEITGYEVTADNWANKVTKSASEFSHAYTGLTNGTEYTFKVRAVNANGAGAETSAKATPTAGSGGIYHLVDWTLPANLKVSYSTSEGTLTCTVIKIGNRYWCEQRNVYLNTTTQVYGVYSEGSQVKYIKGVDGVWGGVNGITLSKTDFAALFFDWVIFHRSEVSGEDIIGSGTVLGRPVLIIKHDSSPYDDLYYLDAEHNINLKKARDYKGEITVTHEVTEWDETVTGFGNIDLPE